MRINLAKILIVAAAICCFSLTAHAQHTSYMVTGLQQTVVIDSKVIGLRKQRITEMLQKQGFVIANNTMQANYSFVLKLAAAGAGVNMNAQLWHKDSLVIDVYSPAMPMSTTVPVTVLIESMWRAVQKEFQQQLEKRVNEQN